MKHTIKTMKLLLYFCLATFLLYSCTEEKEYLENNNRDLKLSRKPFKELLSFKDFNSAYQKVKNEKQKSIASRSAIEDEYNFTIVEGKDVKIVEVDNKTFYNILIQRDSASAAYFENLLLMVEKNNNIDEISAYIVKYEVPDTSILINPSSIDKDITTLFGRVAQTCYTACTPICTTPWGDGTGGEGHIMVSGCTFNHLECSEICVNDPLGGGGGDGLGTGSGGGDPSSDPTPPPPSGANGASPPPELIIDPVFEEEDIAENNKRPCKKINKLIQTTTPTLSSELQSLKAMTSLSVEKGKYSLSNSSSVVQNCTNNSFGELEFPFPPVGVKILYFAHTHNSPSTGTYSIFSWDDLENIAIGIKNNQVDEDFVCFVSTADGTNYAFTINDTEKFSQFFALKGDLNFDMAVAQKRKRANDLYFGTYDLTLNPIIKEGNTDLIADEKAFLDMIKDFDMGITLFEANETFTNFESVTHNPLTGNVDKKPCN